MSKRKVGTSVVMMVSILILSGGMAYSEEPAPLPEVPAEYADKKMPAGFLTDPKVLAEGALIYTGEVNPQVNCASCHGKDGKPVKKGARDFRDKAQMGRMSDAFWFWRVSEGVPKTKMKAWKSQLSEEQIWQVIAYERQFSK
ncbi:MAG: cytochrome c [Nitrospira sp.]|nr:cytochrome c [Nitrospira sp.]TKB75973.1 MAG: cytochrome c [Nitrospira sp.]